MTITIDTVGKALAHNMVVVGHCACGRHHEVDLLAVSVARGEDLPLTMLWRKIRCKCGERPALQIMPRWTPGEGHRTG